MEGTFGEDEVTSEVFDTTLKTPPGDGTHHGLQVLIGSLPCGWLPTDIFLGSKVAKHILFFSSKKYSGCAGFDS